MLRDATMIEAGSRVSTTYRSALPTDSGVPVVEPEPPGGNPLPDTGPAYAGRPYPDKPPSPGDPAIGLFAREQVYRPEPEPRRR
ncbi:hypothetical protein [Streptomyces sp. GbtcB7]|uniref:hypothetical protein n=1 Tax=Streptomyces sp. GbtcB7 TaxID=2824752 RepID=UPI001C2F8B90|nr:hypothetical protein [Streptomyces sp. GbtcB7]